MANEEQHRLREAQQNDQPWYRWGPYLAERQWGTVREDYSSDGNAWASFPHDHARSRAYRWGEDGLLGISDDKQLLCFAPALWNEADPIIKERLFGLTAKEGNHGEDVKECYFFLDNTPTHSYMKALYKYPQRAFPYMDLLEQNRQRGPEAPEFELLDTGVFAENRYFDVTIEYAKAGPQDTLIRISATNRGPEAAPLHILPTLWFRNTWAWGNDDYRPTLDHTQTNEHEQHRLLHARHGELGDYWLACQNQPDLLFTENESNAQRLWGAQNHASFVKDGINDAVVNRHAYTVNPEKTGTKAAAHYILRLEPGETRSVLLRLSAYQQPNPFAGAEELFTVRQREADDFYRTLSPYASDDERLIQRQALAGLLWNKQFYTYDVDKWLQGDPVGPTTPEQPRNRAWRHLSNADIILAPDTWEYPYYASWELAFQAVAMGTIDSKFAKQQLLLTLNEHYMHPAGQLPAHEWKLDDANPPVHAWAAWRLYQHEKMLSGQGDTAFLERVFQKLLLNFTWWVNRKDDKGNDIFSNGFLGLDNMDVFDSMPAGMVLEQTGSTAWLGMFSLNMLAIAVELATTNRVYVDMAVKFLEHFLYIAEAINGSKQNQGGLWNEEDGLFYDRVSLPNGEKRQLKVQSVASFIPLLATEVFSWNKLNAIPELQERLNWFWQNRPEIVALITTWQDVLPAEKSNDNGLLALVRGERLKRLFQHLFAQQEFLSDYGVRSLSRYHAQHPYEWETGYGRLRVAYNPAESNSDSSGSNSNWRGPIWFPLNFLLIEALQRYHQHYGNALQIEYPAGSGTTRSLGEIAEDLTWRLTNVFRRNEQGRRPASGDNPTLQFDPLWNNHMQFYEYFHGDTGAGLGASHQTGWTALVANLLLPLESRIVATARV